MIAAVYPRSSDNNMYKTILFFHMGLCLGRCLSLSSLSAVVIKVGMKILFCFFCKDNAILSKAPKQVIPLKGCLGCLGLFMLPFNDIFWGKTFYILQCSPHIHPNLGGMKEELIDLISPVWHLAISRKGPG